MTQLTKASIVRAFKQLDFDHFARLSGDDNPIHVDPEFSDRTRFGRPVAHGLLLCSVLRGLIDKLLPGGRLIEQSVIFPAPTFAAESMRFVVKVTGSTNRDVEGGLDCQLEVKRLADGIITCQGVARVLI